MGYHLFEKTLDMWQVYYSVGNTVVNIIHEQFCVILFGKPSKKSTQKFSDERCKHQISDSCMTF